MVQQTMQKVQSVIDKYKEQLDANGIKITVSKRYFEEAVNERIGNTGNTAIFNGIDRALDRKRESKKGYNHERNRYHCIILSVSPTQKGAVRREYCREYAFALKKVERAHIGMKPRKRVYEEQKVLLKIEKRINKILKKSKKSTPQKVCKDTFWDAIRYTLTRYGYKRRFLGRKRVDWELIFIVFFGLLAFAVVLVMWLIGKMV